MQFKSGEQWTGNKAGRPKGSTSKNRRDQQIEALCEKHGFNPIEWHIIIASQGKFPRCAPGKPMVLTKTGSQVVDTAHRLMAGRLVADKLFPNLKAIEFEQDTNFTVTIRDIVAESRTQPSAKKKVAKKKAKKKR